MATDVKVPASGESITSANVARWHKQNGDAVRKGEVLVTLETDKVSTELEADADGTLTILVGEGEEVAIGTVIARLEASSSVAASATSAPAPAAVAASAPVVSSASSAAVSGGDCGGHW